MHPCYSLSKAWPHWLTLVLLNTLSLPHPFLTVNKSDNSIHKLNEKTVQILIRWLLQKPSDLDLHCLQRQCLSLFSRTRVKMLRGRHAQAEAKTYQTLLSKSKLHHSSGSEVINHLLMLNSAEHEICPPIKC